MQKHKKRLKNGADMKSQDDAFGSYTGICTGNIYDEPVQDADDL